MLGLRRFKDRAALLVTRFVNAGFEWDRSSVERHPSRTRTRTATRLSSPKSCPTKLVVCRFQLRWLAKSGERYSPPSYIPSSSRCQSIKIVEADSGSRDTA